MASSASRTTPTAPPRRSATWTIRTTTPSRPRGRSRTSARRTRRRDWWGRLWSSTERGRLLPADAEVRVVALRGRLRVVAVGEHGDARWLRRVALAEEPLVVGQHVPPLVPPLVALLGPGLAHQHLREPAVGGELRADGHDLAPDVLHRLRSPDARVGHEHVDGEHAVVGRRAALVGALREDLWPPGPGEDRVVVEVPLVLEPRLGAEPLRGGVQEAASPFLLHGVDRLALVLAHLPVGRESADGVAGEVGDRDAVV